MTDSMQITKLLRQLEGGERGAFDMVIPLVYDELRKLARSHLRRELRAVPLQTTGLVHEVFLKMVDGRHPSYENRAHFYGIASRVMRQVLVDAARAGAAEKRGAAREIAVAVLPEHPTPPNRHLIVVDDLLQRLEKIDPLKGKLIEMRYFGGMTAEESSVALDTPVNKVRRELRIAQAWLRKELVDEKGSATKREP
jgi:RNA polymerase sigma-70 factor (ECF subfamily)